MPEVSAKDVQALRQQTGAGMMDAKRALVEARGDMAEAARLLKERGQAQVAKRAQGREANQGSIGTYVHYQAERPVIGVIVDLASETDFVAKHPDFRAVANDIAMHIAWARPHWIRREDIDPADLEKERERIAAGARAQGKPEDIVPKIIEGKLKSFYEEKVLYDQRFANSEKFDGTVEDYVGQLAAKMGENILVRRMARLEIGG